jgi:hypothetical protein
VWWRPLLHLDGVQGDAHAVVAGLVELAQGLMVWVPQ